MMLFFGLANFETVVAFQIGDQAGAVQLTLGCSIIRVVASLQEPCPAVYFPLQCENLQAAWQSSARTECAGLGHNCYNENTLVQTGCLHVQS